MEPRIPYSGCLMLRLISAMYKNHKLHSDNFSLLRYFFKSKTNCSYLFIFLNFFSAYTFTFVFFLKIVYETVLFHHIFL